MRNNSRWIGSIPLFFFDGVELRVGVRFKKYPNVKEGKLSFSLSEQRAGGCVCNCIKSIFTTVCKCMSLFLSLSLSLSFFLSPGRSPRAAAASFNASSSSSFTSRARRRDLLDIGRLCARRWEGYRRTRSSSRFLHPRLRRRFLVRRRRTPRFVR